MTDIPPRRRRTFDDPLAAEPPRAPAPVAGHPEAPEDEGEAVHIEDETTANFSDARADDSTGNSEPSPQAASPTIDPAQRAERASLINDAIDRASFGITDEIDNLIARAQRLKDFVIDDAARIKTQLQGHIDNGTRVIDMAQRIEGELLELERRRTELLNAQTKG